MSSVYKINKGINKPIEFKGLKAQYIGWLAAGLIVLLILFAVLYITGVNMFVCLFLTLILGVALFMTVYRMSDRYGQHGLLKKLAKRRIPPFVKVRSRKIFTNLKLTNKSPERVTSRTPVARQLAGPGALGSPFRELEGERGQHTTRLIRRYSASYLQNKKEAWT